MEVKLKIEILNKLEMELIHNDNIQTNLHHSEIDLTKPHDIMLIEDEPIEDIINDPIKFQQKLLQNGIVDELFLDFLNEIDESGKPEEDAVEDTQKFITNEIERVKQNYENRISQLQKGHQTELKQYEITIEQLQQRCGDLENKNREYETNQCDKPQNPIKNSFRQNSESTRSGTRKFNRNRSNNRFDIRNKAANSYSKDIQCIEDENMKLRRQLDENIEKHEKANKKWDAKFASQKKTINDLKTECDSVKQQLNQQKIKHTKENNKSRDLINKLEKDIKNMQRGMDNIEKEKSQLKQTYEK